MTLAYWVAIVCLLSFVACFALLAPSVWQASELDTQTATLSKYRADTEKEIAESLGRAKVASADEASATTKLSSVQAKLAAALRDLETATREAGIARVGKESSDRAAKAAVEDASVTAKTITAAAEAKAAIAEQDATSAVSREKDANDRTALLMARERELNSTVVAAELQAQSVLRRVDESKKSEVALLEAIATLNKQHVDLMKQVSGLAPLAAEVKRLEADETRLVNRVAELNARAAAVGIDEAGAETARNALAALKLNLSGIEREIGGAEERISRANQTQISITQLDAKKSVLEAEVVRVQSLVDVLTTRHEALVRAVAQTEAAERAAEKLRVAYDSLLKIIVEIGTRVGAGVLSPQPTAPGGSN